MFFPLFTAIINISLWLCFAPSENITPLPSTGDIPRIGPSTDSAVPAFFTLEPPIHCQPMLVGIQWPSCLCEMLEGRNSSVHGSWPGKFVD